MSTIPHDLRSVTPRLEALGFDGVAFDLVTPAGHVVRRVSVAVGSGSSWRRAVLFPNVISEDGCTTGDDELDALIRAEASVELLRLEAACEAARWRSAA